MRDQSSQRFMTLAGALDAGKVIALVELAGRCDQYDRGAPMREQGQATMLPYLNDARAVSYLLEVRAFYLIRSGKPDEALAMIRDELELARKVAQEPIMVSGLVGQEIISSMTIPLIELMNRPESPNLYWALASLPRQMVNLQNSMNSTRFLLSSTTPELAGGKIDDLSGDDWRRLFARNVAAFKEAFSKQPASATAWENDQTVADEVQRTLPEARDYYARTRHLPPDRVEAMDSFKIVATFWYEQYLALNDDFFKLTALPYPVMLAKMEEFGKQRDQLRGEQPANVFLFAEMNYRGARRYARADRLLAALTDVEAIRSYAAANKGSLPAKLEDITDTPALDDPATGKPFDYSVQGDTATLADAGSTGQAMKYVIRIRK
jgi:hypothetical protein